ncbi:4-hyroxy-2-oxovalerate aldolase [Mycobacterium sp. 852002-51163_SCH5372311]|uniref:4-hyroxy-2-oxovalerate aldolase n=1 Tax=Mycobacterium sp. 852002-51163_SCH5372311 TaxID=1834097 RepID=UPI000800F182|nr:4-hyroxy-2-oxovalerate aldolase [Mycobacterium sp. 852002-51163_SCH5372311]OBF87931.1 4-hyroxy-2-oxovalerate aldolase [Mycobacterium sp. 852002-51163_SCH5372311]
MKRQPVILDTTIRDGSYAVNFQYTGEDLRNIIVDLDVAGIPYIEIGHGVTIGANAAQGRAAQTDEEYLRIGRSVVRNAKLGAVIVPALAPIETVDLAGDHLDFLRMCVLADEFDNVTPFVERARAKGLEVSIQLVKSHLFDPDVLAKVAGQAYDAGVGIVYVVDTTGTFLPEDVRRYVETIRAASDVTVGYHGHNNLGMAVANTLEAFDAGADFLDGTLMAFGRGAGNCQTECLIAALQRRGHLPSIDLDRILDAARSRMLGRTRESYGIDPWEVSFGLHGLDSTQVAHLRTSAENAGLSVSRVIREISKSIDGPWLSADDIDQVIAGMRA